MKGDTMQGDTIQRVLERRERAINDLEIKVTSTDKLITLVVPWLSNICALGDEGIEAVARLEQLAQSRQDNEFRFDPTADEAAKNIDTFIQLISSAGSYRWAG